MQERHGGASHIMVDIKQREVIQEGPEQDTAPVIFFQLGTTY